MYNSILDIIRYQIPQYIDDINTLVAYRRAFKPFDEALFNQHRDRLIKLISTEIKGTYTIYEILCLKTGNTWYKKFSSKGFVSSCTYKDGAITGTFEDYYNGKDTLYCRIVFKDRVQDGLEEYFYENGFIKKRSTYNQGVLNGIYEQWYVYVNGCVHGITEERRYNGNLYIKESYNNGVLDGIHEYYNEEGELVERYFNKNDKPNGLYQRFNKGKLIEQGTLVDDKLEGPYYTFDDNRKIIETCLYENNIIEQ